MEVEGYGRSSSASPSRRISELNGTSIKRGESVCGRLVFTMHLFAAHRRERTTASTFCSTLNDDAIVTAAAVTTTTADPD